LKKWRLSKPLGSLLKAEQDLLQILLPAY